MQQDPEPEEKLLSDGEESEEEYGGPVKPFLEHLEDFRWTLVRVVVSVGLGMLVCLIASNRIVHVLMAPLHRANLLMEEYFRGQIEEGGGEVYFQMGTNIWRQTLSSNDFKAYPSTGTNIVSFRIEPVLSGTNVVLGMVPIEKPKLERALNPKGQLINIGPFEGFRVALQVALYGGLGLASPFVFLFVGQFVLPALKRKEKKWLYQAVTVGGGLFAIGVLFAYYMLLPVVILAAVQFSQWLGFGADIWRGSEYIGTVCKLMLGMGLGFELPVIILTLVKLDLLEHQTMKKFRPYFIVVNMVISAFIMPPDGLTMFLMAIPMQILFEISLLIARFWSRKNKQLAATELPERTK